MGVSQTCQAYVSNFTLDDDWNWLYQLSLNSLVDDYDDLLRSDPLRHNYSKPLYDYQIINLILILTLTGINIIFRLPHNSSPNRVFMRVYQFGHCKLPAIAFFRVIIISPYLSLLIMWIYISIK